MKAAKLGSLYIFKTLQIFLHSRQFKVVPTISRSIIIEKHTEVYYFGKTK
jgi:hypothetical protein